MQIGSSLANDARCNGLRRTTYTKTETIIMLRSKSTQPITQAVGRCAFCGTRLAAAPKRMASHRAFSSQSAAIAAPAFSGWQMPRWQLSRRTQRARYSSVLNAIQTPHPTPSSASLILQNARPRSRTYATIIEVPTATEDDLPEPVLQRGEESESTTISVTPAAEKVCLPATIGDACCWLWKLI